MSGRAPKILIVDDDPSDVAIIEIILKDAELACVLEVCEDGEQASLYFANRKPDAPLPDLVLLDLNMPKKDGRTVLSEIKADPTTADIPVIILTTAASPEDMDAFHAFKNTTCLIKPYVLKDYAPIVAAIQSHLVGSP
jgi:CheY-like chemotaxis protein